MRIFISHSHAQAREAAALRQWLIDTGIRADDIFLDIDFTYGLKAGEKWRKGLLQAIKRCEVMLCLLSEDWENSSECQAEFRLAEGWDREIVPVRLTDETQTATSDYQWVDLTGDGDRTDVTFEIDGRRDNLPFPSNGLDRLRDLIADSGVGAHTFPWPPDGEKRAPYPGGLHFAVEDAGVYFGRDAQILRALDTLREMPASGKTILQIIGHSGAGKSSFLRAGLISRLRRDSSNYRVLDIVRPGGDVIDGPGGLVSSIQEFLDQRDGAKSPKRVDLARICRDEDPTSLWQTLHGDGDTSEQPIFILPIDQAEELVTVESDSGKGSAKRLLQLLDAHANQPDRPPLIVVMTLRTDHLEVLEAAMAEAGLDSESTEVFADLGPIPEAQFASIIEEPARRTTVKGGGELHINPRLTEQLIKDCQGASGSLPLLALTLARLYKLYSSDGDLRLDEYEHMGGMTKVVEAEVNEVLSPDRESRDKELALLKPAFVGTLAMLNLETDQVVRRVATWNEFAPEAVPLLGKFVNKHLLVSGKKGGTVEVAVEGFFDYWSELKGWLDESRDDLRQSAVLKRELDLWLTNKRSDDYLLHGQRLRAAEEFMGSKPDVAFKTEDDQKLATEFLKRSRKKERRSTVLRVAAVAAVILTVLAVVVGMAYRATDRQNRAMQLVAEAEGMLQGVLPGGDISALQKLVAAEDLAGDRGVPTAWAVANLRRDVVKIFENPPATHDAGEQTVTPMNDIAVSPDGRLLASANGDNRVRVWDTETGTEPFEPLAIDEDSPVSSVTFFGPVKDGEATALAAAGIDGGLSVWNLGSEPSLLFKKSSSDTGGITDVAFSDDGKLIATGGNDGEIRVWDTTLNHDMVMNANANKPGFSIRSIAFEPKVIDDLRGKTTKPGPPRLVSVGDDGIVRLWDVSVQQQIRLFGVPEKSVAASSVAFDYQGNCLAVGRYDGTIEVLDAANFVALASIRAHPGTVNALAYSPAGTRIVSGGDSDVRVWETIRDPGRTGCQTRGLTEIGEPLTGHHGVVTSVKFDNRGTRIMSSGADGSARIWDVGSSLPIPAQQGPVRSIAATTRGGRPDSLDKVMIASGGVDGTVKLWNKTGPQGQLGAPNSGAEITALGFSPNGTKLVTGSKDGFLRVWDRNTSRPLPAPPFLAATDPVRVGNGEWIKSVAVSDSLIATGDAAGFVRLWDLDSLRPVAQRAAGVTGDQQGVDGSEAQYQVWSVAFDCSGGKTDSECPGKRLVSGSGFDVGTPRGENNILQMWKVDPSASGDSALAPTDPVMGRQPGQNVYSVAFSPDGGTIASGGNDGTVRFWDPKTGEEKRSPMGADQNAVMSIAFSPNGESVAAGGADGKVRIWSVETGELRVGLDGHHTWVHGVAYAGDDLLASASADGTLRLWPTPQSTLKDLLCPKISNAEMGRRPWNDPLLWWAGDVDYCPGS